MNIYVLLVIGILLYFLNEWLNLKYLNNKIQQTKNELKQEINNIKTTLQNGTKI